MSSISLGSSGARLRATFLTIVFVPFFAVLMAHPTHAQVISIATGSTAGSYYPLGGVMAELINQHIPGARANAEVTGASVENVRLVASGRAEIALANANAPYYAYVGQPPFNQVHDNLRAIAAHHPSVMQIVARRDSGITSILDLKGKRVNVGAPGGANSVLSWVILEAYGFSRGDIREGRLTFSEVVDAFKNRQMDAAFILSAFPVSALIDLTTSLDMVFLPVDSEIQAKILAEHPYYVPYELPAGTYVGQNEPVPSVSVWNIIFTRAELDEDLVYQLTKLFYENVDLFIQAHPISRFMTLENAPIVPIPLHEGAARYFREVGVLPAEGN